MIWVILKAEWRYLFEGAFAELAFSLSSVMLVVILVWLACMGCAREFGYCAFSICDHSRRYLDSKPDMAG